ncbi:unnamed protein product [Acanthoscelides obtectus]|uniref:Uncharacterized protein n=1 Tax=Acanthoscelides obtectus TaxID=200917 RepID=A0A9P0LV87_ACAOB|nr:unnamed protein product [Acanthoscelides obtectus]CAK1650382.1 hypothetical protein AOBTE_LOCUS16754 [Acanthoscelides obtectus]
MWEYMDNHQKLDLAKNSQHLIYHLQWIYLVREKMSFHISEMLQRL